MHRIVSVINHVDACIKIVVDPVIRSTTAFDFWQNGIDQALLDDVLNKITLITPNYKETVQLVPDASAKEAAKRLSHYCPVFLKGGHNEDKLGVDYLYHNREIIKPAPGVETVFPKHGSGCVLSAAITDNLSARLKFGSSVHQCQSVYRKIFNQ